MVGREVSRRRRPAGDVPAGNPADAPAPRPDPEAPLPIDEERRYLVRRKAGRFVGRDAAVHDPRESSPGGAGPDASAGVRGEGDDGVVREAFAGREGPGARFFQANDPVRGRSGPDDARPIDAERPNQEAGGSAGRIDSPEARPFEPEESLVLRSDPQHSAPVARERLDLPAREAFAGAERREAPSLHAEEAPAVRADPERAVLVGEEGEDGIGGEVGDRPAVEESEPGAVEADEAFLCPDPEVAVGSLGDRLDGVLREPLPRFPAVEGRVGDGAGRVEREGRGARGQEDEERRGPRAPDTSPDAAGELSGRALFPEEHRLNDRAAGLRRKPAARAPRPGIVSRRGASWRPRGRSRCSAGSPARGSG